MAAESTEREPFVGKKLSESEFAISDDVLEDYYKGLALEPTAGRVPATIASAVDNAYFLQIAFSNHFGHLWMRQEWECLAPLEQGKRYRVAGEIVDIYPKRDRTVVNYRVDIFDADQLVVRTHHHQSFLVGRDPTGEVEFRDPSEKPGARKFSVPDGERFGGLERTITLEMCGDFFHGDANYHTNRDSSRELGFRDVVVGGRMTMAYASHVLEERFGDAWSSSGRLDVKFTNPAWANDTVTTLGVATGPLADGHGRVGAFVWVAKPDDTIVLVAQASVAMS